MLGDFAIYLRHGFGFTKSFRFAFGITVRDFLINLVLLVLIVGLLTGLCINAMEILANVQEQQASEQAAQVKVMESILTQCLSDATGRPVVIDNEIYLCGIVKTGVTL